MNPEERELTAEDVSDWAESIKQEFGLLRFDVWLSSAGRGTLLKLNMIEVPKEARGQGIGSQALRALANYADEHALRITLTPGQRDRHHGTTSHSRLITFYRKFGFVRNRGRHIDFTISDAMYRNPTRDRALSRS